MNCTLTNKKWEQKIRTFLLPIFYFFFLISYFFLSEATGSVVSEVEIKGLHSIAKEELLELLDIILNEQIDSRQIRQGIKRAYLKGIFEDISIEAEDGERVKIFIDVKEKDFIDKVSIDGDLGLSRKIIKRIFLFKEGEAMRYEIIEKAVEELRQEMAMRGFPLARITAEIERLKEPYRIHIHLHINAGESIKIKKITLSGIVEEKIKEIMSLSEGDIYDQVKLRKDMERIKTYYQKKGYFKPLVGPYTFIDGILSISVTPGKCLSIAINGNSAISKKNLLKEMPFFEVEDFRDDIVEEAVERMLSLYHSKGYAYAQIAPVIASRDDLIDLNFFIYEGSKVKVRGIDFTGITLPKKSLKEVMSLKEGGIYNLALVESDREAMKEFYKALGYLSANIEEFKTRYDESSQEMDISVRILEGPKTEVERIHVVGSDLINEEEIRKAIRIKPGDSYNEIDISDARYRIINLYNSRGFSDVMVFVERSFDAQEAAITFHIQEGDVTFFGKTIVRGNYRTNYEVVKREFKRPEGKPFDYSILSRARQRLYKLGLFTNVDMEILDRYDHKKDILVKLDEGNAGTVEFGFGYADYEKFRGFLDLSYRNLWGMNRQSSVRIELSSLEERYIFQYQEPWFLGKEIPFRLLLLREDRREIDIDSRETRFKLTRYTATAGIEKRLSDTMKLELYHEVSRVKTYDVQPDVILSKEDTGTLLISGIKPGIVYDTRDNPFDPKKGILSGISLKFTSPVFLSETDFVKLLLHGSVYHQLHKRFILALSLRGGIAEGYNETRELPIVERFFLGGRMTVRGYAQDTLGPKGEDGNPTGGNAYFCGNLELRTSLGKGIGIVTFIDGGNVWLKTSDIDIGNLKYTAGLGLRYSTPIGPIRIDYGRKLNREHRESRGEIHFSIGHAF